MGGQVNINGAWKNINGVYVNIGGVWKPATSLKCNIGGVWKDGWNSGIGGIDSYTKLMLHMNGVDASTTFTDSSLTPKTMTANGNAQIGTAQSKFGGASAFFDGTSHIDTPDHSDFDVGSGNFTIDAWVKRNILNNQANYICGQCDNAVTGILTSILISITASDAVSFTVCSGSNYYTATSTIKINNTNWHHIECCRDGNTLRIFIDGVLDGTKDVTGITVNNSPNRFAIGRGGEFPNGLFNGWIDEFRFSKGIARHTSNFTPPTSEYTIS